MNRTLLLIICDFLLLSLLALARFDDPEEAEAKQRDAVVATSQAAVEQDLIEMLKLSLEAEREDSDTTTQRLRSAESKLAEKQRLIAEQSSTLEQMRDDSQQLLAEKQRLQEERERIAQNLQALKQNAVAEQARLSNEVSTVRQQLGSVDAERKKMIADLAKLRESSGASAERMLLMQKELQAKQAAIAKLTEKAQDLESEKRVIEYEKHALESRVQVAETEAKVMSASLETARADIELTRKEKERIQETTNKLAEGVTQLADSTEKIHEEVKRVKPLSMNSLFDKYMRNKVSLSFKTHEEELIGTAKHEYEIDTLLATDADGRTYAVMHIEQTPFDTIDLISVDGFLQVKDKRYRIQQVGFLASDPRIVMVAVPQAVWSAAGIEAFELTADPLLFPEAAIIDGQQKYYGESPFKVDPEQQDYLRMKTDLFSRVFGEFSPEIGDLVIAENGELLGLMINDNYSYIIPELQSQYTLKLGEEFSTDRANSLLRWVRQRMGDLPKELR